VTASPVVEYLMASHGRVALADADALGRRRPASPERLDRGVVERVADGAQRVGQAGSADALAECSRRVLRPVVAVYQGSPGGLAASMAMPSAALTIAAVARRSSDQPTTRRDQASSTTQQ
jgi:hypothetical protein